MTRQDIDIAILPDGRIEYTIRGIKGSTCESVSALLEQLGKVELEERTGEYYDSESDANITLRRDKSASESRPALPAETEIYIMPDGQIVVADLPIELVRGFLSIAEIDTHDFSV